MGSQQAKYKQTPQSGSTLQTVGCDWKGRRDWTILLTSKVFFIRKTSISIISNLHKRSSIAHRLVFQSLKINRFLFAQIGEVTLSRLSFCLLTFSISRQSQKLSHLPRARSFNTSQNVMGGLLIFIPILFGYAVNCHLCTLQRRTWYYAFPDWDSNPRVLFAGPRC